MARRLRPLSQYLDAPPPGGCPAAHRLGLPARAVAVARLAHRRGSRRRSSRASARPRAARRARPCLGADCGFLWFLPSGAALGFVGVDGSDRKRLWPCSLARLLPRGCCRCFWIFFPYRILCNPNVARPPRPLQGAGRAGTKPYRAYKAYSVFVETSQAAPLLASRQLIKTSNVTTFRRVM